MESSLFSDNLTLHNPSHAKQANSTKDVALAAANRSEVHLLRYTHHCQGQRYSWSYYGLWKPLKFCQESASYIVDGLGPGLDLCDMD